MKFDLKQRTVFRGEDGELYKTIRPPRSSVKVWKDETDDGVEATHVRVPISSTSEDRDGDEFTEDGLEHMVGQLQSGDVPMFLDHGISPETGFQDYRALEAVGGWKDGEIEDGVVYGIGALDPDMQEAEELAQRLENGVVPVGWSVGFIPHETESKEEGEDGERFREHDLLEVSSVGIPSNPDGVSASIAQAAKSYARSRGVDVDAEQLARNMTEQLERAIEKADDDELAELVAAVDTFRSEADADEPSVADFLTWAGEELEEDTFADLANAAQSYLETLDVDDDATLEEVAAAEPLDALEQWATEQLDEDDEDDESDEEEESEDGDDEDDEGDEEEDGTEPTETDDEDDGGDTITTDTVDEIASAVGDAVGRQLEQHRELMLEQLDAAPSETDEEGDGDGEDDEDGDEDDEESSTAPDSSTSSFAGEPRAVTTFASNGDGDEKGASGDEEEATEKTGGTPAAPRFNPGTSTNE